MERYRSVVADYFPANYVSQALAIMTCESHGDPTDYGDRTLICKAGAELIPNCWTYRYGDSSGLFQIRYLSQASTRAIELDPTTNIKAAASMFKTRGWQPWTNSRNKAHI